MEFFGLLLLRRTKQGGGHLHFKGIWLEIDTLLESCELLINKSHERVDVVKVGQLQVHSNLLLNSCLTLSNLQWLRLLDQLFDVIGIFVSKCLQVFAYFLVFVIASHADFDVCEIPFNHMMLEQVEDEVDIALIKTLTHLNEDLRILWEID